MLSPILVYHPQVHVFSDAEKSKSPEHQVRVLRLSPENLSAALENLFRKASKEVLRFNDAKQVKKIGTESNGILFCNTRMLESAELKAVGHLADTINIADFTGVNFKVPIIDQHSPLALVLHFTCIIVSSLIGELRANTGCVFSLQVLLKQDQYLTRSLKTVFIARN